jgi:hypothetical protein
MTQIWIAMCMSLLLAFIKFSNTIAALSFDIFEILREKRVGYFLHTTNETDTKAQTKLFNYYKN